jgi:hypothetical protein
MKHGVNRLRGWHLKMVVRFAVAELFQDEETQCAAPAVCPTRHPGIAPSAASSCRSHGASGPAAAVASAVMLQLPEVLHADDCANTTL